MKKILSVLLASLLLLSTSATAFAMETETNADNWLVSANQHTLWMNSGFRGMIRAQTRI